MTDRAPEQRVVDFLRAGPDVASSEFVEATLRPIPRMRQRRSWRIRLGRFGGPLVQPVAIGLAVAVIVGSIVVVGSIGNGIGRPTLPIEPTFELLLAPTDPDGDIPDTGPYVADPNATTNACTRLDDGFWRIRYSGGDPYVRLDVVLGPEASIAGRSEAVSAEIVIGSPLTTLINFDQPGYRSGDAPGRSTAAVETTVGPEAIAFDITATTPRAEMDFSDYPYTIDVDLRIVCPT